MSKRFLALFAVLMFAATASAETYDVVGTGKNGDVHVAVTIEAGKIVSVQLREHHETPGIYEAAAEKIPQSIIDNQSINFDSVSGVTMASYAIKTTIAEALKLTCLNVDDYRKSVAKAEGRLMCEMVGESLILENGNVTGIRAKQLNIKADVVLLVTGSYIGRNKIIKRY